MILNQLEVCEVELIGVREGELDEKGAIGLNAGGAHAVDSIRQHEECVLAVVDIGKGSLRVVQTGSSPYVAIDAEVEVGLVLRVTFRIEKVEFGELQAEVQKSVLAAVDLGEGVRSSLQAAHPC